MCEVPCVDIYNKQYTIYLSRHFATNIMKQTINDINDMNFLESSLYSVYICVKRPQYVLTIIHVITNVYTKISDTSLPF